MNTSLVREMVTREIDTTNIMTLLRVVKEEISPDEAEAFFIPGGKEVPLKKLYELSTMKAVEDVVQGLNKTSYHKILADRLQAFFESNSLAELERGLEQASVSRGIRMFRAEPVSIASLIGYIWAKYNEIVNLRIIARGKAVGMPEAKIREAMIIA